MSLPGITQATVVVIALAVAGVPVARRLCGLACEADSGHRGHAR